MPNPPDAQAETRIGRAARSRTYIARATPLLLAVCLWLVPHSALLAQSRPAAATDLGGNLPAQRIGADDLIAISIYDAPELSRTIRVSPEGNIRIPMLKKRIRAMGLMPAEL